MNRNQKEYNRLDKHAEFYLKHDMRSASGNFDFWLIEYGTKLIRNNLKSTRVLELGCATGHSTALLLESITDLTIVDGSQKILTKTKNHITRNKLDKGKNVEYVRELWEVFAPSKKYSEIVFTHGLEHVENPIALLMTIKSWLTPRGRIHIIVPNAQSLHRQIGVKMGLLKNVSELNETDIALGHFRVYDVPKLKKHVEQAGLHVKDYTGIYLKPLGNAQMLKWDKKLIQAYFEMGKEFPDMCAEIYLICGT